MTQKERVMHYINKFGSISPIEAFYNLGITKLATVVSDLKKDGIHFYQEMEHSKNRFGEPVCYMRYWTSEQQYIKDLDDIINIGRI